MNLKTISILISKVSWILNDSKWQHCYSANFTSPLLSLITNKKHISAAQCSLSLPLLLSIRCPSAHSLSLRRLLLPVLVCVYVCMYVNVYLFACVLQRTKVVPIKYKQLAVCLHPIQCMHM